VGRRLTRATLAAIFSGIAAQGAHGEDSALSAKGGENMDLIRTISAHQTAALERVKSIALTIHSEERYDFDAADLLGISSVAIPKGRRIDRREGTWVHKGTFCRADFTLESQIGEGQFREKTVMSVLLNDEYFVELRKAEYGRIDMYMARPGEGPSERLRYRAEGWMNPDPRRYGFGAGVNSIQNLLTAYGDRSTWHVKPIELGGEHLYEITNISPPSRTGPIRWMFIVDPAKDFLVRRAQSLKGDGSTGRSVDVKLMQLANGSWFPQHILDRYETSRGYSLEIRVLEAKLDPLPDNHWFTIEALSFDPTSTTLSRFFPDGASQKMAFYGGEWMPFELVPENSRPRQPSPVSGGPGIR
jgi:hypothetical protein